MKSIVVNTSARTEFVDITEQVQAAVEELGVDDGVVTVFVPHTTAGVTINENADPDVLHDLEMALEKAVPWTAGYRHGEGNSAAHLKSSMMGFSEQLLVENGRLLRGTWQGVYFCEFDGPRTRKVWVK
jgi:secondary thiamine-phosphate synthase enzyme